MNSIPGDEVQNQTLILVLLLGEPFHGGICMQRVCAVTFAHVHRVGVVIPLFCIPHFIASPEFHSHKEKNLYNILVGN